MKFELQAYVRGNFGRGDEVIETLTELDAKNENGLDGSNPDCLYFIDHDGLINCVNAETEQGKIIMDCYEEVKLTMPRKWKDGDIVTYRYQPNCYGVVKQLSARGRGDWIGYFCVEGYGGMVQNQPIIPTCNYHLATKSERKKFRKTLHKYHKDWDAAKKQLVDWWWKPKNGEIFYFLDCIEKISYYKWDADSIFCAEAYKIHNCFRTEKEAEAMAEKMKKVLKGGGQCQ